MTVIRKNPLHFVLFLSTFFVALSSYAQLEFIENKGQWESPVNFKTAIQTGAFFLEKNGFTVFLQDPKDLEALTEQVHGHAAVETDPSVKSKQKAAPGTDQRLVVHSHSYKVNFVGASPAVTIIPDKVKPTYNNYFIGNDQSKWQSNCRLYEAVTYKNIYRNIDIRYYTDAGKLKYDIIVRPGADVDDIAIRYEGVNSLAVKNKELVIGTSVGEVKELYPYTYQLQNGVRQTLDCKYVVKNNIVRFKIKDYDPGSTIVIDPTLIFCTFTGSTEDNWGYTATPGPDGSFFAGGIVFGAGYPASLGAASQVFGGGVSEGENKGYDIGIMKFSANGSQRLYGTYLGGRGNEQPHSMICDAQGNLIVAGRSNSSDYPPAGRISKFGVGGGYDIVVTKFNPGGTALIASVKIGGENNDGVNIRPKYENPFGADATRRNYGDDARSEIILDNNNNIYVASCSQSTKFPVINSTIQGAFAGGRQDGVIIKLRPDLSNIIFSTYFGGRGDDACFVLSQNPATGNMYVAGGTTSNDLPGDKTNVIANTYQGGETDGFVTELTPDGATLIKTTYIGTAGNDLTYGIQFDRSGFPYIMGTTTGNWPVLNATFSNAGAKQFICKLFPDLSAYVYSTVFGTNKSLPNLSPVAFLVDRCENVYVSGWGGGTNQTQGYPSSGTTGMPITANAIQSRGDGADFYFFVLEKNAGSQLFGSYFGQIGGFGDHVDGGTSRFDANGVIYQAICANCAGGSAFPTTPGVWSASNGSPGCNEAAVKIEMNFAGVKGSIKTEIDGVPYDTVGCLPLTIKVSDTVRAAKKYIWVWGDGTKTDTTVASSSEHTYTREGWFRIMLIAEDSIKCNIRDTVYRSIRVSTNRAYLAFDYAKAGECTALDYQFTNTSRATIGSFSSRGFVWNYGDGSPNDTLGISDRQIHRFPSPGSYTVSLCVIDTFICNSPDCVDTVIRVSPNVKAAFETPAKGCVKYTAVFTNTSLGGNTFIWEFGDGTTSTEVSPVHEYTSVGTYKVRLIAFDINTCNKVDTSAYFTITVYPLPVAQFTWAPNPPKNNTPTNFTNTSSGADNYIWDFGDGETSTDKNVSHQFNATKVFNVCLQAISNNGCIDTTCQPVDALVTPLLEVPNAFTPGKFGENGIIKVISFGIGRMNWRIYNRWGQLIFETANTNTGWDGTYKGALQPMDVYTYTLEVEFTDGKKVRKTGDITLLR